MGLRRLVRQTKTAVGFASGIEKQAHDSGRASKPLVQVRHGLVKQVDHLECAAVCPRIGFAERLDQVVAYSLRLGARCF